METTGAPEIDRRGFDQALGTSFGAPAIVVHPVLPGRPSAESRSPEAKLDEIEGLAAAIRLDVRGRELVRLRTMSPATLLGKGQLERVAADVQAHDAEVVIMDAAITPIQQKNLETALKAKVIDRTGLILEIFGERAATAEGRLQVELAHLEYQAGRLVRSWTHLERQRGGFGFLGGPGETQIETDRRLLRDRIARLKKELESVRRTRTLHRSRRQRAPNPVIALVGYTNAGKSTLFNRLTGADVMAENLLFATLDPTMRAIHLPGAGPQGTKVILSDTVGFISDLPTELVAAFRATLEEVIEADLLVHVRDLSHPDTEAQAADVKAILGSLGVLEGAGRVPMIEALNKADKLDADTHEAAIERTSRDPDVILVSALTGEGIEELKALLAERLQSPGEIHEIRLHPSDGKRLAWLHANGEVISQRDDGGAIHLQVRLDAEKERRFRAL
ncbi:GTPase HflX [Sandaracinobacter neustonicus]|uniref:GTPase HflX n=1 Tax=Sandaracinobacter neustonicus TaxID=1715348 RepID=A0A501XEV1_9SPHN|nr:GTPase HflX [Sandaracinobacter neustonicus]TPE59040.1 GTPase HflX [Sandaracinobacter neustonicus]